MSYLLKIIGTNWIHIFGFYITTYFTVILSNFFGFKEHYTWAEVFLLSIISIPFLFFTYGLVIITSFVACISILDIAGFSWNNKYLTQTLVIQWLLIILCFVFWAFQYQYWLWLTLTLSFLATQFLRRKIIERILHYQFGNKK